MYLHHDGSVSTNVFCTQVLCSESVVSFLTSNFIIWGWDLTLANNRQQLLSTIARHFDSLTSRTLRNFVVDKLPLLLIATRSRSSNEILTIVQGSVNVDEMMTQLLHSVEMFSEQQRIDIVEEDEREAREQVKREQDEAYQASLQADRSASFTSPFLIISVNNTFNCSMLLSTGPRRSSANRARPRSSARSKRSAPRRKMKNRY